ncbi:MAG TPA: DNA gyrase modulator, partial [Acidimicrobiales bacterium]|nr:DNA gyrase modulator [Acidimicrobiales bacterium]
MAARGATSALVETPVVETVLAAALARGAEFAEVFAEDRRGTAATLDDGRVEELSSGRDRGAGIRVVVGETTGYAHTADLSEDGLLRAAEAATAVARQGGGRTRVLSLDRQSPPRPSSIEIPPEQVAKARKIELLERANDTARSAGTAVTQVSAQYADSRRRVVVANSDGVMVDDDQVRSRFSVSCVAVGDTGMQTGYDVQGF